MDAVQKAEPIEVLFGTYMSCSVRLAQGTILYVIQIPTGMAFLMVYGPPISIRKRYLGEREC